MMTVAQIVSAFEEIIGWPYASPGSNSSSGIDCSGAFVYAYKKYGFNIYHGSNRIVRVYCNNPITLTRESQLKVGMAIFKSRSDLSQLNASYKPGGQYYNAALPNDYYHVGLVTSVNPLQIVNATAPMARVDTKLSPWSTAAYLNAVDYEDDAPGTDSDSGSDSDSATPASGQAITAATSGNTVNLRKEPSASATVLVRVPLGRTVDILSKYNDIWWEIRYQNTTGYMMQEFLKAICS